MADDHQDDLKDDQKHIHGNKTASDPVLNDKPLNGIVDQSAPNPLNQNGKKTKWKRPGTIEIPNKESKWTKSSIVINAALLIAGFYTLYETRLSTAAAIKSADAAENTYKQQRANDSITRHNDSVKSVHDEIAQLNKEKRDSEQFVINIANERKRFRNDSASTEAQIRSLREIQKQFQLGNEPYLEVANFSIDSISERWVSFNYILKNLGNYPVELINERYNLKIGHLKPPPDTAFINALQNRSINTLISKDFSPSRNMKIEMRPGETKGYVKGDLFIYYYFETKYKNLIDGTTNTWVSLLRIRSRSFDYLINRPLPRNKPTQLLRSSAKTW